VTLIGFKYCLVLEEHPTDSQESADSTEAEEEGEIASPPTKASPEVQSPHEPLAAPPVQMHSEANVRDSQEYAADIQPITLDTISRSLFLVRPRSASPPEADPIIRLESQSSGLLPLPQSQPPQKRPRQADFGSSSQGNTNAIPITPSELCSSATNWRKPSELPKTKSPDRWRDLPPAPSAGASATSTSAWSSMRPFSPRVTNSRLSAMHAKENLQKP
jgi:hypothetical protein